MANVYPIILFNDSDLTLEPPCLNSGLEETLYMYDVYMCMKRDLPMAQSSSIFPLSDDGAHGENTMTMSHIGPRWRGQSDEVVTEVDKGLYVLPVVEIVVLYATERNVYM